MSQHDQIRRQGKKTALCGMMAALSAVVLCLGGMVPLATFTCPILAMLCLIPVLCEYGTGTALLLYGAVSILALLLGLDKEAVLFYTFLGWYPSVRSRVDSIHVPVRWLVKCGLFTLAMMAMYALALYLFRLEAVTEEFAGYSNVMVFGLLVLGNVTFLAFDRVLARFSALYQEKRKR